MKTSFIKLLCMCIIIICTITAARAQTWAWAKKGNGKGYGNSISTDANGYTAMTGIFTSSTIAFGTHTLNCTSGAAMFIVKYDPNGNVLWAQGTSGGNANSSSIHTDAGGNIYVTGNYEGSTLVFGSHTLTATGVAYYHHVFLVKYDPDGNVVWVKGSNGTDGEGTSVCSDVNGNAYVTGYYNGLNGPISFDSYTFTNPGNSLNIFIVKYDVNGNVVWAKASTGAGYNTASSVSLDASANIFITGSFGQVMALESYTLTNNGHSDAFLLKYDPNGNILWAKSTSGDGDEKSACVTTDLNGNAYITGSATSQTIAFGSIILTSTAQVSGKAFLAKYDAAGNVVWAKIHANSLSSTGRSVLIKANTLYHTGYFYQQITLDSQTLTADANATDPLYIASYDLSGTLINATSLSSGGSGTSGLCADQFCNLYIAGTFQAASFIVGTSTLTGITNQNPFAAKLSFPCVAVGIEQLPDEDKEILISPNPSCGMFMINSNLASNRRSVQIFNVLGQTINKSYLSSGKNEIDISGQVNGIYFINIYEDNRLVSQKKIIKE